MIGLNNGLGGCFGETGICRRRVGTDTSNSKYSSAANQLQSVNTPARQYSKINGIGTHHSSTAAVSYTHLTLPTTPYV